MSAMHGHRRDALVEREGNEIAPHEEDIYYDFRLQLPPGEADPATRSPNGLAVAGVVARVTYFQTFFSFSRHGKTMSLTSWTAAPPSWAPS